MANTILRYPLSNGFIHNWLVAGPLVIPVPDLSSFPAEELELNIARQYSQPELDVTLPPVDLGSLGPVTDTNPSICWRYYRCQEDHLVDFSATFPTCAFLRSWAYAGVHVSDEREATLVLSAYGPAEIWLNGQRLHRWEAFHKNSLQRMSLQANLQPGTNDLLIRFETVAIRDTPYALALQIQGLADEQVEILLPTEIAPAYLEKRKVLEKVIEKAYLDRYVYGYLTGDRYDKNEPIVLRFAQDLDVAGEITHRLQSLHNDIFQSGIKRCEAGAEFALARTFPLRNGPHHLALLPVEAEYYLQKIQFERKDLFYVVRTPFALEPYSTIDERSREALEDASQRRNESIFCEIAKIALGRWERVDRKILNQAIERINGRQEGSVVDLLGFVSILSRFWKQRFFLDDVRPAIERAIKHTRYWSEDPQREAMDYLSESRQLLFHTCELLAGQLLPEGKFVDSGKSGRWHREQGEQRLLAWLREHGQYGFCEWDSPAGVEAILTALSHLVDLAKSEAVRELASVLMDKIFFSLAINSWKGMYGSSRGRSDTASVLSHRLEHTSGITRLMWGLGNFNESVMGTVSLACCRRYELPQVIRKIALEPESALWGRERQTSSPSVDNSWAVNKVTYKTADFLLSSAQDYYPGTPGRQEHIWQATLGPDAVVFTNHPQCLRDDDTARPNLWVGNGVLPRVAQWGDVLIALYRLPEDDWLGYTHAYFPANAFDEYTFEGRWAFARKGKAYLALYAARGLEWITGGKTAYRELRSHGLENAWLCHLGLEMLDGSFADFQHKILTMDVHVDNLSVRLTSLRGDALSFAWKGPLWVNGQEQALSGFKHFENPYCVAELPTGQMDILYGDEGIRLGFE